MATILCDMDSIISDFYFQILEDHCFETGEDLPPEHIDTWDKKIGKQTMIHYFGAPGFFRRLRPIEGAESVLKWLSDNGQEVVIVSSATLPNAPGEKLGWLAEHYPWLSKNRIIFAAEKWRVKGDFLIDDSPDNVSDYRKYHPGAKLLGIAYPYNDLRISKKAQLAPWDLLAPSYRDTNAAWSVIQGALSVWLGIKL